MHIISNVYAKVAFCAGAALVAGCGGGNGQVSSSSSQTRQVVERVEGPFRITASIPRRTYRKGEAIVITFRVTNQSSERLSTYSFLGGNFGYLNQGGFLGQFRVQQDSTPVFDSLPEIARHSPEEFEAGATLTEIYQWRQSDVRTYFPLRSPYPEGIFAPDTAALGEYQIVPRLNFRSYVVRSPDDPNLLAEPLYLNNRQEVTLPPLNIAIEP